MKNFFKQSDNPYDFTAIFNKPANVYQEKKQTKIRNLHWVILVLNLVVVFGTSKGYQNIQEDMVSKENSNTALTTVINKEKSSVPKELAPTISAKSYMLHQADEKGWKYVYVERRNQLSTGVEEMAKREGLTLVWNGNNPIVDRDTMIVAENVTSFSNLLMQMSLQYGLKITVKGDTLTVYNNETK